MTVGTAKPSVFDAGLPTLSYGLTDTPQEIYPQFRAAQEIAPIALGPIARSAFVQSRQGRASRPPVRRPEGDTPVRTRHHVWSAVGQGDPQHLEHGGR
jgi:hypothetical protein